DLSAAIGINLYLILGHEEATMNERSFIVKWSSRAKSRDPAEFLTALRLRQARQTCHGVLRVRSPLRSPLRMTTVNTPKTSALIPRVISLPRRLRPVTCRPAGFVPSRPATPVAGRFEPLSLVLGTGSLSSGGARFFRYRPAIARATPGPGA